MLKCARLYCPPLPSHTQWICREVWCSHAHADAHTKRIQSALLGRSMADHNQHTLVLIGQCDARATAMQALSTTRLTEFDPMPTWKCAYTHCTMVQSLNGSQYGDVFYPVSYLMLVQKVR